MLHHNLRRGVKTNFNLLSLSPACWLDCSNPDTLYTDTVNRVSGDGQNVYRVNDLSGNERHFVQPNTQKPIYRTTGLGTPQHHVDFIGAATATNGDWLYLYPTPTFLLVNSPKSIFSVSQRGINGTVNRHEFIASTNHNAVNADNRSRGYHIITGASGGGTWHYQVMSRGDYYHLNQGIGTPSVMTFITGQDYNPITFLRNGLPLTGTLTDTLTRPGITELVNGGFIIGRYALISASMRLGEVIMFDRVVTDEERISIETYLKEKWGTP